MLETQTNDFTYKIIVRRTKQETKQKNNKIKQTQTKKSEGQLAQSSARFAFEAPFPPKGLSGFYIVFF